VFIIFCVANAVIHETRLPYFKSKMNFPFHAIALDESQCLLQRDFRCRCQQQMEVIGMITNSCSRNRLFRRFLRQPRTLVRGPPEAEPCDRMEEARGVRLSSRSRKTYGLIGELGAFSPGLKPGHCKIKRSRGFENPLPRTEVGAGTDQACSLLPNSVPGVRRPTPWLSKCRNSRPRTASWAKFSRPRSTSSGQALWD
jgi:hypothetical protein